MAKEKVVFVVVAAFLAGFLSGTLITVWKTTEAPFQPAGPQERSSFTTPLPPAEGTIDPEKARRMEEALRNLAARTPEQSDTWTRLGNFYFDTNQYQKAIEAYERSLALQPDEPDVLTDLGIMYRRVGNPEKAAELFQKALTIDPRHVQSLFNLGIVRRNELKDIPGAIEAWEKYLQIDPENVHAVMVRAWIEELKKQRKGLTQ